MVPISAIAENKFLIQESYYFFFQSKKVKYWKIRISNKTIIGAELLIRQWNKLLLLFFINEEGGQKDLQPFGCPSF